MEKRIKIAGREIGEGCPVFVIAELSANHDTGLCAGKADHKGGSGRRSRCCKASDLYGRSITIDCDNSYFQITQGTLWDGTTLHKLYQTAYTPWERYRGS